MVSKTRTKGLNWVLGHEKDTVAETDHFHYATAYIRRLDVINRGFS